MITNFRYTLWSQAISYLSGNYLPNISQKEEGITKLVKDLAPYDLTKAEKLQIVNLAPTRPVELYVVCFPKKFLSCVLFVFDDRVHWQIVEELEDRFGEDRIEEILGHVKESLTQSHSDTINSHGINGALSVQTASLIVEQDHWDIDADAPYEEDMYDDTGEGAGVEGDLDMEEDWTEHSAVV